MAEAPNTEKTAFSKKVRRSVFGITLHGWEQLMLLALGATGLVAIAVALTTTSVVILQRHETAEAKRELEEYKVEAGTKISAAEAVGLTAKADIAKAHVSIAEADARTKEAEVKLEELRKQVGPRHLKSQEFIEALVGKPTLPVEIMFLKDDADAFTLSLEIRTALQMAGWPVQEPCQYPQQRFRNSRGCRPLWG
jgi:flagellar basal body-associated protein FliL